MVRSISILKRMLGFGSGDTCAPNNEVEEREADGNKPHEVVLRRRRHDIIQCCGWMCTIVEGSGFRHEE